MILFLIVIALLALSVCYALFGSPRSDPWFLKPRPCNQKVEARAVFVGICHNNAKYLPRVTRQIEACGALFQDYKVIVYENDSTDGTTQLLKEWARQNPRVSIQCDLLKVGSAIRDTGSRTQKLAGYRNRVLSMARKLCPGYELTVVVDMDVHWEPETVAHAARDLIRRDDVSFVTANGLWRHKPGVYDYYDIFAYRDRVMNRGAESFRESPDEPVNKFYNRYNQWRYARGSLQDYTTDLYVRRQTKRRVQSAFGGLAIYKTRDLGNCYYRAEGCDCEHIGLHECIGTERGLVDPELVVRYNEE